MGQGKLAIACIFSRTDKPASMKGSLSNFPMALLNDILQPQAKVKIESGTISKLTFNFKFNDIRSDGTVDLSYKDLKVISLRKARKKEKKRKDTEDVVKNEVLSFVLNIFIKEDAGKAVTGEKKTGTILFYRDRKKAIFNYWWKSLFSGLKSSFNIENDAAQGKKKKKE